MIFHWAFCHFWTGKKFSYSKSARIVLLFDLKKEQGSHLVSILYSVFLLIVLSLPSLFDLVELSRF